MNDMSNTLYYDDLEKRYWRCPVERCVREFDKLVPYQAEEQFSSPAPYSDISHDMQVRIWKNDDGLLAILLLYDMTSMDGGATWRSDLNGFGYKEVYVLEHKESRASYILAKNAKNLWGLMSLFSTDDYEAPIIQKKNIVRLFNSVTALFRKVNLDIRDYNVKGIKEINFDRITPDNITSLADNEVFVFGSNLQGKHRGGAARLAHNSFGAVWGLGAGLAGNSYAIPTMHGGVDAIKPYVDQFIEVARIMDSKFFYVTKIGCGIAGFTVGQMAPLFKDALELENVALPKEFVYYLRDNA